MRCVDWEHNERFDSTQARRQKENFCPVAKSPRRRQGRPSRQRPASRRNPLICLPREAVIRVRIQAPDNARAQFSDGAPGIAPAPGPCSHWRCTRSSSVFSPRISRYPASGSIDPPRRITISRTFRDPRAAAGRDAGDDVRMAGQIFRGAVQHQVESQVQRLLQHRRTKRAVDHRDQFVFARQRHGFFQIDQLQRGICGRLHVQDACFRVHQPIHALQAGLHEMGANPHARQRVPEEIERPAVDLPRGDDFVSGLAAPPAGRWKSPPFPKRSPARPRRFPGRRSWLRPRPASDCRSACRGRRSICPRPTVSVPAVSAKLKFEVRTIGVVTGTFKPCRGSPL